MSDELMRIELLLACPPTRKCRAIRELANAAITKCPGRIRIDEYEAGTACPITPTDGYRRARSGKGKFKKVPSVFVNGVEMAVGDAPDREAFFELIANQLEAERAL
jgi:hypothetical protein